MDAAFEGKSECLPVLIQAKADVNLQDKARWSEVSGCSIDYLVLESGCDNHDITRDEFDRNVYAYHVLHIQSPPPMQKGETALDIAKRKGNVACVPWLEMVVQ